MLDRARFLAAFVRQPFATGSITPSSAHLAAAMVEGMRLREADTVVEIGPGTGVFTRAIREELKPEARFLCFEINGEMAAGLRTRFPGVEVVNDSVEHLDHHLGASGEPSVDAAICGLPWAAFSEDQQMRLLDATVKSLRPDGRFSTFAYSGAAWLPAGRRFRELLNSRFRRVVKSPIVWRNMPPAFVYRCQR